MSQLHMDHEQPQPQPQHLHHHQQDSFEDHTSGRPTTSAYDPPDQLPLQDYNGFSNYAPLPSESLYTQAMPPPPPLSMPQWPSMLTSQSTYAPPIFPSAPVPITPWSATPLSTSSTHSGRTSSTPRKKLTDADRRKMCQYHEDHPTVKQSELGVMFGVERSTVSKVLRQREKYLYQDDGSRSPTKRPEGGPIDRDERDDRRSWRDDRDSRRSPSPWRDIYSSAHKSRYNSRSPSLHSIASYGSIGSVDSGASHPPRMGTRRKRVVDMSFTEFTKQTSEESTEWSPSSGQPGSGKFQRPRSQTFPMLVGAEQDVSPPATSPQAAPVMTETSPISPSREEAVRALEVVWTFVVQQQHEDLVLEPQELLTIGRLMEKFKFKRTLEKPL